MFVVEWLAADGVTAYAAVREYHVMEVGALAYETLDGRPGVFSGGTWLRIYEPTSAHLDHLIHHGHLSESLQDVPGYSETTA